MNISGNEISGTADPTIMFFIVGGIILVGFIIGVVYTIYTMIGK